VVGDDGGDGETAQAIDGGEVRDPPLAVGREGLRRRPRGAFNFKHGRFQLRRRGSKFKVSEGFVMAF
jgi:hypothetical protein